MPAPRGGRTSLVEHLNLQAPKKPVSNVLSLSKYYVSADLLLRQASTYRTVKNEEQLYVILMRFASLIIETIPSHHDFKKGKPDAKYQELKKSLMTQFLPELETIKLSLRTKDVIGDPVAHSKNRPPEAVQLVTSNLPGVNWAQSSASPGAPAPAQQQFLVDDLMEIVNRGRGAPAGTSGPPPPPPMSSFQNAASAPPPPAHLSPTYQAKYHLQGADSGGRHVLFSPKSSESTSGRYQAPSSQAASSVYSGLTPYPTLNQMNLGGTGQPPPPPGYLQQQQQQYLQQPPAPSAGPSLGPQELEVVTYSADPHMGHPGTCSSTPPTPPPLATPPASNQLALYSVPPPPPTDASPGGGMRQVEKKAQLRDVHVSVAMMEDFLHFAASNTRKGIESCGILAGRLAPDDSIFTITTLIIPKQQGTTDTVQALNEEEVFEVQFEKELYPLGWIHTHPTQTCFLSSVDVHTHCGYQTMLEESVAIVMAPTDSTKKCGIFRLSTPGGLSLVQKCPLRGFHAHPDTSTGQELYELCGHVYLNPKTKHEVIDLR